MRRRGAIVLVLCAAAAAMASGCNGSNNNSAGNDPLIKTAPQKIDWRKPGEPTYKVRFETSRGDIVIAVYRNWAPLGADRFKELVESGFYDGCRFFRVTDLYVQVGINGDPAVGAQWKDKTIPDDPLVASNVHSYVTFATSGPKSRTTQIFFNLKDNSGLDSFSTSFSPFGKVVEGMDVVQHLYGGYGEIAPHGQGPSQQMINQRGNKYLDENFPKLDFIKKASVIAAEAPKTNSK